MEELKDAKGYRSKYINQLNKAVKTNRIIGGDVTPIETDAGTLLKVEQRSPSVRFQLFSGIAPVGEEGDLINALCVGDGAFYINNELQPLTNGMNVIFLTEGIRPRSAGWASKGCKTLSSWNYCDVLIVKYGLQYYLIFRYDSEPLYPLISDSLTEEAEAEIELIVKIGTFDKRYNYRIDQIVRSDIFITAEKAKGLQPWQLIQRSDKWLIVNPEWELNLPNILSETPEPSPKELLFNFKEQLTPIVIDDVNCYELVQLTGAFKKDAIYLYASFDFEGAVSLQWSNARDLTRQPNRILIGQAKMSEIDEGVILDSFTQREQGIFYSEWTETEPFFYMPQGSSFMRMLEAPTGLDEGTTAEKSRFWMIKTYVGERFYAEGENLAYEGLNFPPFQLASKYGSYVWRFALHYRASDKALIIDTVTSAVSNIPAELYAQEVAQPFVERIAVTYPSSPLEQGSVDAVGGTVRVLQVGKKVEQSTRLFATEALNTTDGTLIETV